MKYAFWGILICFGIVIIMLLFQQIKNGNRGRLDENRYLDAEESTRKNIMSSYNKFVKPLIDRILAFCGLVVLSPIFLLICVVIYVNDPGPVFFSQKRFGKNREIFMLHKFRTMKICTPHDTPTHMLENPDQYITSIGKILRKTSLDEIPQIWNIFLGDMSIIGPRPALWNQYDLIEERDRYGANDVKPGLTGWAQINGRDELQIEEKAKLDGYYIEKISFGFDVKCFFGTIISVLKRDGIVEGGTGKIYKKDEVDEK